MLRSLFTSYSVLRIILYLVLPRDILRLNPHVSSSPTGLVGPRLRRAGRDHLDVLSLLAAGLAPSHGNIGAGGAQSVQGDNHEHGHRIKDVGAVFFPGRLAGNSLDVRQTALLFNLLPLVLGHGRVLAHGEVNLSVDGPDLPVKTSATAGPCQHRGRKDAPG